MRIYPLLLALLLALGFSSRLLAQSPIPQMQTVEPASGKSGDILTVTGANLGTDIVSALYLTDGKVDTKVEITQQSATEIKFKVPASRTGRLALMVLTKGAAPKLIEEPVKVVIETAAPPTS